MTENFEAAMLSYRIQRLRESLQQIADSKDSKNWRKPELIYVAQLALELDSK
jgi:hypothetical protein